MTDYKKMKALIISAGTIDDNSLIKNNISSNTIIICADGGLVHCLNDSIPPHYIIGDFDSADSTLLKDASLKNSKIIRHSTEKDKSDTELALDIAISLKVSEITFLGCTGTRIDHFLANLHLLAKAMQRGIKASIIDRNNTISLISESSEFSTKKGDIFSLLPLSEMVTGINTTGLKYPLEEGRMEVGKPYGISNEATGRKVSISIKAGLLIVIQAID